MISTSQLSGHEKLIVALSTAGVGLAVYLVSKLVADGNKVLELETALAVSKAKVTAYENAQADAIAKAAELDCCADGACGLGQKVLSVTEWCGGNKFNSKAEPEGHEFMLETGGGGEHIAPMQAVLGCASTCAAVGLLTKLQEKCTVDKLTIKVRACVRVHSVRGLIKRVCEHSP